MKVTAVYPSLKDRVVVITGGAQGLGRAYAEHFADQGALPVIVDFDGEKANSVCESLKQRGRKGLAIQADVADPKSTEAMAAKTLAAFGRIDALINNAALFSKITLAPFWELPIDEWRRAMDVNVTGAFLCSRAVVPAMQKAGWGRIVNVSSSTVMNGRPNYLHYIASKSALIGMTRAMAKELGQWNITVNVYLPTATQTEVERPSAQRAHFERLAGEQAIRRIAEMSDHAATMLFLCSEEAGFITGQSHLVDGGRAFI
jgi:3-oxoacyl-[acyl-carrier protein] reductase